MMRYALTAIGLLIISSVTIGTTYTVESQSNRAKQHLIETIEKYVRTSVDDSYYGDQTTIDLSITNSRSLEKLTCPKQSLSITSVTSSTLRSGRSTLLLECQTDHNRWKRYASVNVRVLIPTIVSSKPLRKGQVITKRDIQTQPINHTKLRRGYFQDQKLVSGRKALRNVGTNQVITPAMIERSYVVEEGDSVSIYSKNSALSVSADGIALSNGVKGDRVLVRNVRSKKVLKAIVRKPGVVIVH